VTAGHPPGRFPGNILRLAETFSTVMTHLASSVRPNGSANPSKIDWEAALARHERWLRTVVYTRVGQPQAVEDVMQEVSLAAVRQQAPLSDASKVAPWLYRLAVRQSLLYRRAQGRRRKLTSRLAERERPAEQDNRESDPLGWLLAEERRRLIRNALERMPKRDAEILLLKYTEDWSYRDLAHHLGVTESAVQARLHRARKRMRSELAALDVTEAEA
jgi:RNA polymerase sigma factor (sigma-70 family)